MEIAKIVERAKNAVGARSDRALSLHLGHAPNYICKLLQDENPSADALAELIEVGKGDPTVQVLQFLGDREGKRVKKIIDRALKALSAASLAVPFLLGGASEHPANASIEKPASIYIMRQLRRRLNNRVRDTQRLLKALFTTDLSSFDSVPA